MLVVRNVSAGVGLRPLFRAQLIVERGQIRLCATDEPPLTFEGPIQVNRSWLSPLLMSTDIVLGRHPTSHDDVVVRTGGRTASKVIAACRLAGVTTTTRRSIF